jgi:hypothetical protein
MIKEIGPQRLRRKLQPTEKTALSHLSSLLRLLQ